MRSDEEKQARREARTEKRKERERQAMRKHVVLCPHCGKEVLDHMTECPFCHGALTPRGYGGRDEKKFKIIRIVSYIVFFAIAITVFAVVLALSH